MTTFIIYFILIMITTPFVADLFIRNLEPGGIMEWYDRKVLLPLRLRNSKWEKPLGGCAECFTTWMATALATAGWIFYAIQKPSWWWIIITPTITFISMGIASMAFKFYTSKNSTHGK